MVLGPSTPLAPTLINDYGVSQVTGIVPTAPLGMFECLEEGDSLDMFNFGHRVTLGS